VTRTGPWRLNEDASEQGKVVGATTTPRIRRGDESAWFRRFRATGDSAIRDGLVERYMPLAMHLARRYPTGNEREDINQVASLALVNAVDRFDPDKGAAFASFATPTILGEIKRYFRDHGWSMRVPRELQELTVSVERVAADLSGRLGRAPTVAELAKGLGVGQERVMEALQSATAHRPDPLDAPARDEDAPQRELAAADDPGYGIVEDAVTVESLLVLLPERDRAVIELRFRHDLLQREIAEVLGISQMQVSRILSRAIGSLQDRAAES
jgi:RNA polymerase sigma-B factor